MKKIIILSGLLVICAINAYGQWYVKKYEVTDIDYLTQQQLEESIRDTRVGVYGSLGIMGLGGVIALLEQLLPYKEEDDENVTLIESILGENGMHKVTIASGVGISTGGAIASIVYLGRLGTLKSALRRNFPSEGSLSLSPSLILERTSHNLCPGVTLTYNF